MKKYWHQFKDSFVLIAHGITILFTKINGDYGSEYQTSNKVIQRMIESCGEFECGSIIVVEDNTAVEEASGLIAGTDSNEVSDLVAGQESSDQGIEGTQDQTDIQKDQMVEDNSKIEDVATAQIDQESSDQGMTLDQAISYMADNYSMPRTISKRESVLNYASKMGIDIVIQA